MIEHLIWKSRLKTWGTAYHSIFKHRNGVSSKHSNQENYESSDKTTYLVRWGLKCLNEAFTLKTVSCLPRWHFKDHIWMNILNSCLFRNFGYQWNVKTEQSNKKKWVQWAANLHSILCIISMFEHLYSEPSELPMKTAFLAIVEPYFNSNLLICLQRQNFWIFLMCNLYGSDNQTQNLLSCLPTQQF